MREILFRAKRKDNEEWVYGSLIHVQDEINKDVDIYRIQPYKYEDTTLGKPFEVKKETIGQYIGMNDIKGYKIFEGDILQIETNYYNKKEIHTQIIKWDNDIENDSFGEPLTMGYCLPGVKMKIIGNIYDNKEIKNNE